MKPTLTTKSDAILLFGGTLKSMALSLGVTVQAVSQWPEQLTDRQRHECLGAAIDLGIIRIQEYRRRRRHVGAGNKEA